MRIAKMTPWSFFQIRKPLDAKSGFAILHVFILILEWTLVATLLIVKHVVPITRKISDFGFGGVIYSLSRGIQTFPLYSLSCLGQFLYTMLLLQMLNRLPVVKSITVSRCRCPSTRNCGSSTSLLIATLFGPAFHLYRISRIVYPTNAAARTDKACHLENHLFINTVRTVFKNRKKLSHRTQLLHQFSGIYSVDYFILLK